MLTILLPSSHLAVHNSKEKTPALAPQSRHPCQWNIQFELTVISVFSAKAFTENAAPRRAPNSSPSRVLTEVIK